MAGQIRVKILSRVAEASGEMLTQFANINPQEALNNSKES
jgi:hypothetical protein